MSDVKFHELTKSLGSKISVSEERGARFVDALAASIHGSLAAGKDVAISGFGTFSPIGFTPSQRANLLGDICARLGETGEQRARSILDTVLDAVKKELMAGKRIVLDDLGVFEVKHERPKIERQPKGHRLIKAAASGVVFSSFAGAPKATFTPSDDLKRQVESFKGSSIMLIVPERDFFAKTLEYYFQSAGWEIETFTKIPDALAKIDQGQAYLVILDAGLPEHQNFCTTLKTRRETTNVPLILMFPSEASFKIVSEVTVVGDENLAQPFEFRELLDHADTQIMRSAEEGLIFLQQLNVHLPTDEASIEKVIETVHKLLESSGLNEEGQVAMSAAFREGVVNAAQHGHRYKREKKIEVQYLLDSEKITAVVKDQGQGFNHEIYVKSGSTRDAITAARERHAQGRMGGLGIMLMLRCCDRLEYNQQGNRITLTKYLKPKA